jgi:hypothetical protein
VPWPMVIPVKFARKMHPAGGAPQGLLRLKKALR